MAFGFGQMPQQPIDPLTGLPVGMQPQGQFAESFGMPADPTTGKTYVPPAPSADNPITQRSALLPFGALRSGQPVAAMPAAVYEPLAAGAGLYDDFVNKGGRVDSDAAGKSLEAVTSAMGGGLVAGVRKAPGEAVLGSGPIRAFHGSPHDFDRFDVSKIGTGEGAQAYGHGLYFAENERTANAYRTALAGPDQPRDVATKLGPLSDALPRLAQDDPLGYRGALEYHVRQSYKPPEKANDMIRGELNRTIANFEGGHIPMDERALGDARAAVHFLEKYQPNVVAPKRAGHMYEVGINADPSKLIDYDAPLKEQSGVIRQMLGAGLPDPRSVRPKDPVLRNLVDRAARQADRPEDIPLFIDNDQGLYAAGMRLAKQNKADPDLSPGDYVGNAAAPYIKALAGQNVSGDDLLKLYRGREADLAKAGVPGVQYYDAMSRSSQDGSRNYVTFSDSIVDILRKYGLAGAIGAGAALSMPRDAEAAPGPPIRGFGQF